MTQITSDLKIVFPIRETSTGEATIYAYHHPISREVFDSNYRIISATQSALFAKGIAYAAQAGPRVATLRLLDEGRRDAADRGDVDAQGQLRDGGAGALLAEIKRLTTVLSPSSAGWDMLPIDAAIRAGHLDDEDWREVESAAVFFTVAFWMAKKADREMRAKATAGVMGAQITLLSATEFNASLRTSKPVETSAAPKAASSVPS